MPLSLAFSVNLSGSNLGSFRKSSSTFEYDEAAEAFTAPPRLNAINSPIIKSNIAAIV